MRATLVRVNFDTKIADTDNAVTPGTNWVFTVPTGKGGLYHVIARPSLLASETRWWSTHAAIYVNNTKLDWTEIDAQSQAVNSLMSGWPGHIGISAYLPLQPGDTVDVRLTTDPGGYINPKSYIQIRRVSETY